MNVNHHHINLSFISYVFTYTGVDDVVLGDEASILLYNLAIMSLNHFFMYNMVTNTRTTRRTQTYMKKSPFQCLHPNWVFDTHCPA
ncbi:hypothetical protein EYC80_001701 [Monilinia laxa]|uniref:Uncharacterized protein n=1 Tax=Monilinia laxa TaxID=61186 RepID=A0A5N6K5Q2_MONLA|nr:hypothetical protein EYC80_001701 [Monilinia laxa]